MKEERKGCCGDEGLRNECTDLEIDRGPILRGVNVGLHQMRALPQQEATILLTAAQLYTVHVKERTCTSCFNLESPGFSSQYHRHREIGHVTITMRIVHLQSKHLIRTRNRPFGLRPSLINA